VTVPALAVTAQRWATRWAEVSHAPRRFLPAWAADRIDELVARVVTLPDQLPEEALCHFDVPDDNLLIRPNGQALIFDWGMARRGPSWTDHVLLAAQSPTADQAQSWLGRWVPAEAQDTVTSLLVAFAGSQAWNAHQPPKPGLPSLPAFTRDDAQRLFAIARLRLVG
jgi:serine/threonine protein kinase